MGLGLGFLALGYWLIHRSSAFLIDLEFFTGTELFRKVAYNNFLFIRLGDVFLLFGIFILLNDYLKKACGQRLGVKPLKSISSTILSFMAASLVLGCISILNTAGPSQKAL